MCTSIAFNGASGALYFGRNLDWESGFGEVPVFAPRNWSCTWAFNGELANNPACLDARRRAAGRARNRNCRTGHAFVLRLHE